MSPMGLNSLTEAMHRNMEEMPQSAAKGWEESGEREHMTSEQQLMGIWGANFDTNKKPDAGLMRLGFQNINGLPVDNHEWASWQEANKFAHAH